MADRDRNRTVVRRTFLVEKGVPLPPKGTAWPFEEMQVGDSFFAPSKPADGGVTRSAISSAVKAAREKLRMKFTTRAETGGWRVWRTE